MPWISRKRHALLTERYVRGPVIAELASAASLRKMADVMALMQDEEREKVLRPEVAHNYTALWSVDDMVRLLDAAADEHESRADALRAARPGNPGKGS